MDKLDTDMQTQRMMERQANELADKMEADSSLFQRED